MNKGKNCFFAILVFGLTMAVFNGMSVVLAVSASIGGGIIQGANGVNMTYDYLMDHMNFYSVLVYLIPLAILDFGTISHLWIRKVQKIPCP